MSEGAFSYPWAVGFFFGNTEWGDGWMPIRVTPEQVKMGRAAIDELAEVAGRDPKSIRVMVRSVPPNGTRLCGWKKRGPTG